ncbi:hypothetical protein [Polynucleobacter antarcticus]|nr:hypothetical protein [Polynucleobacter antarcticus]
MFTLINVLMFIGVIAGLGLFLNAYYKGKKVLGKLKDKHAPKTWPIE